MVNALWITLIGMGMVFVAILLLWGLMEVIVWLTTEKKPAILPVVETEGNQLFVETGRGRSQKQQAAAAAVAAALALHKQTREEVSTPPLPTTTLSAWQAAHRAGAIGQQFSNKKTKVMR